MLASVFCGASGSTSCLATIESMARSILYLVRNACCLLIPCSRVAALAASRLKDGLLFWALMAPPSKSVCSLLILPLPAFASKYRRYFVTTLRLGGDACARLTEGGSPGDKELACEAGSGNDNVGDNRSDKCLKQEWRASCLHEHSRTRPIWHLAGAVELPPVRLERSACSLIEQ